MDCYALADVCLMPSHGEEFGIVLVEAMACGIPAVSSQVDGGRGAPIDGQLGTLVDPENRNEICGATPVAIRQSKMRPARLEHISYEDFPQREWEEICDVNCLGKKR